MKPAKDTMLRDNRSGNVALEAESLCFERKTHPAMPPPISSVGLSLHRRATWLHVLQNVRERCFIECRILLRPITTKVNNPTVIWTSNNINRIEVRSQYLTI